LVASTIAPVTKIFTSDRGKRSFHPYAINWSYRGRIKAARNRMNRITKTNILIKNHTTGGKNDGHNHPPKNNTVIKEEINKIPKYSPTKNIPNFIPEYSE